MSKDALDRDLDDLEAELSAVLRWQNLPPALQQKLFARLREVKAYAGEMRARKLA